MEALFARTLEAFGALSGVFSNAGTASRGWLHEMDLETWRRVIDVNLTGAFLCARHALPIMLEAGAGVFVTTGSVASIVVGPGGSAASYAASKGGLLQLTRQIAVDYAPRGIRAVCVLPGIVQSNLAKHMAEDAESGHLLGGSTAAAAHALVADPARRRAGRGGRRRLVHPLGRSLVHYRHRPAGRRRSDRGVTARPG